MVATLSATLDYKVVLETSLDLSLSVLDTVGDDQDKQADLFEKIDEIV